MGKGEPTPYDQIPAEDLGNSVEQTSGATDKAVEQNQETQADEQDQIQQTDEVSNEQSTQTDEIQETEQEEQQEQTQQTEQQQEQTVDDQQTETPSEEQVKLKPIIPKLDFQQQQYSEEDFRKEAFDDNGEKTANYENALIKLATARGVEQTEKNQQQRQFQQGVIDVANKDTKNWNEHGNDFLQWLSNGANNLAVIDYWGLYKKSQGIAEGAGVNPTNRTLQRIGKNLNRKGSIVNINNTDIRAEKREISAAEEEVNADLGVWVE